MNNQIARQKPSFSTAITTDKFQRAIITHCKTRTEQDVLHHLSFRRCLPILHYKSARQER